MILGATSDYVYRGVSQRSGQPTPLAFLSIASGPAYAEGFLVGVDLGEDADNRSIGNVEADLTLGLRHRWDSIEFNVGAKHTGYPNGRDIIAGTLQRAERDFIEPFAGVKYQVLETVSIGATVFWTPDFYYETGAVRTLEGQAQWTLPALGAMNLKLSGFIGQVRSELDNVVCPGNEYHYYNVGLEGQIQQFVFDIRHWNTSVDGFEAFDQRLVLSAGIAF